jgi:cytochrome c551/c552
MAPIATPVLSASSPASAPASASAPAPARAPVPVPAKPGAGLALMQKNGCTACHGVSTKVLGPGFTEVADKYRAAAGAAAALFNKVKNGSSGAWGPMPMPPQSQISDADAKALVQWILGGAK